MSLEKRYKYNELFVCNTQRYSTPALSVSRPLQGIGEPLRESEQTLSVQRYMRAGSIVNAIT